jgi:hypothetical protein
MRQDGPWKKISPAGLERCLEFGVNVVKDWQRPERAATRNRSWGDSDKDPLLQGEARIGECILALTFGQHPDILNWEIGKEDGGIDMTLDRDTFDARTTKSDSAQFLHQTLNRGEVLAERIRADKLVLVQIKYDKAKGLCGGCCRGYATKALFLEKHLIADASRPLRGDGQRQLSIGTAYMTFHQLYDINELIDAHKIKQFSEGDREGATGE